MLTGWCVELVASESGRTSAEAIGGGRAIRWIRYFLRLVLVILVLVDVKLVTRLVAPPDDHFFKPTVTDWLLTGLSCLLFVSVQAFIVWLDIRIGRRRRRQETGGLRR